MTASIRNFLVTNLLVSVVIITSLTMVANFFFENKELQNQLDIKLAESAFAIQAFMSQTPGAEELARIQKNIDSISVVQYPLTYHKDANVFANSHENFRFQVNNREGEVVLHSATPLPEPFASTFIGLSHGKFQKKAWRLFATIDPITKTKIIVAQQYDFRDLLAGQITQESILAMLISYPFLGLLIWIIIGRGLSSLQRVSDEVRRRAPDHLESIDVSQVPIEIKAIVVEWNKLFARLKAAFEREKRFAADAAHELKTPLAALKAHTQVALNAKNETEREAALRKILTGVDRSAHVVQQLLTLSRVGQGAALESSSVNIVRQAKEVMAELAPEALQKNSEIELIAPDTEPLIQGYPTAIAILIRNLVDNAIRYTPENSFVRVIIEEEPAKGVILKVIDNGPGIPEHLRRQVFERFFRLLGNKSPGSGLGLGIVQQITELHQGKISLDTPPNGHGLQVTIIFPVKHSQITEAY